MAKFNDLSRPEQQVLKDVLRLARAGVPYAFAVEMKEDERQLLLDALNELDREERDRRHEIVHEIAIRPRIGGGVERLTVQDGYRNYPPIFGRDAT